jgi:hypothetical protein
VLGVAACHFRVRKRIRPVICDSETQVLVGISPPAFQLGNQPFRSIHLLDFLIARGKSNLLITKLPKDRTAVIRMHDRYLVWSRRLFRASPAPRPRSDSLGCTLRHWNVTFRFPDETNIGQLTNSCHLLAYYSVGRFWPKSARCPNNLVRGSACGLEGPPDLRKLQPLVHPAALSGKNNRRSKNRATR